MTKRHFNLIAAAFREARERSTFCAYDSNTVDGVLGRLTDDLCDIFAAENRLFDRDRFKAACALPPVPAPTAHSH